jgi:hypothetical protein
MKSDRFLRYPIVSAAAAFALFFQPLTSLSAVLDFDFSLVPGSNPLPSEVIAGGVTAHAFYVKSGQYHDTALWKRDEKGEHGLGICSEPVKSCKSGGGDVNEISNQKNDEVLRLTLPGGQRWSALWVSSLDSGGSGKNETGTLYWSSLPTPDLKAPGIGSFRFDYDAIAPATEADLLPLLPGSFDATAKYLFFRAGGNTKGKNNDYLVWGGNVSEVPEPSSVVVLIIGGAALGTLVLSRTRAAL